MIKLKPLEAKEISLKIKTLVIDPEGGDFSAEEMVALLQRIFDGENVSEEEISEVVGEEDTSEIELCTEAKITLGENGSIEISYMENEDDEQLKTHSRIIFSQKEPSLVVMAKDGAMSAYLSFEQGKTHICTYDTPFMPIKVYVNSQLVDNRLLTDGELRLNYVLTLNDTDPQHFAVEVKIKENEPDLIKERLL